MTRKGANKRGLRAERGSIYPEAHPPGSKVLLRVSGSDFSAFDRAMVVCSSLFVVGAVVWVPVAYAWLWKRWSKIPKDQKRRRMWCGALLLALPAVAAIGPHRHPRWGRMLQFRRWGLWMSWLRFVAFEVVSDAVSNDKKVMDLHAERSLLAIIPHGIFPFALGFPALAEAAKNVFGPFRPIVASATAFVPFVKTLLDWLSCMYVCLPSLFLSFSSCVTICLTRSLTTVMLHGWLSTGPCLPADRVLAWLQVVLPKCLWAIPSREPTQTRNTPS